MRRRMLLSEKEKEDSINNSSGKKTYIFQNGQFLIGAKLNSNSSHLKENNLYVIGKEYEVKVDGPTSYVFPEDKGYTSKEQVVAYYASQGYNIAKDDVEVTERHESSDGQLYFYPNLDKYITTETHTGGSIEIKLPPESETFSITNYSNIGFNITDLKNSGYNPPKFTIEQNSFPNQKNFNQKNKEFTIKEGINSCSLNEITNEYKTIIFKCFSVGNPVYKITEIYLEE